MSVYLERRADSAVMMKLSLRHSDSTVSNQRNYPPSPLTPVQVLTGMRGFDASNQLLGDVSQPCEVRTTSFIMTFGPFETHDDDA